MRKTRSQREINGVVVARIYHIKEKNMSKQKQKVIMYI